MLTRLKFKDCLSKPAFVLKCVLFLGKTLPGKKVNSVQILYVSAWKHHQKGNIGAVPLPSYLTICSAAALTRIFNLNCKYDSHVYENIT